MRVLKRDLVALNETGANTLGVYWAIAWYLRKLGHVVPRQCVYAAAGANLPALPHNVED